MRAESRANHYEISMLANIRRLERPCQRPECAGLSSFPLTPFPVSPNRRHGREGEVLFRPRSLAIDLPPNSEHDHFEALEVRWTD